jgi:hypothetical protein
LVVSFEAASVAEASTAVLLVVQLVASLSVLQAVPHSESMAGPLSVLLEEQLWEWTAVRL